MSWLVFFPPAAGQIFGDVLGINNQASRCLTLYLTLYLTLFAADDVFASSAASLAFYLFPAQLFKDRQARQHRATRCNAHHGIE